MRVFRSAARRAPEPAHRESRDGFTLFFAIATIRARSLSSRDFIDEPADARSDQPVHVLRAQPGRRVHHVSW